MFHAHYYFVLLYIDVPLIVPASDYCYCHCCVEALVAGAGRTVAASEAAGWDWRSSAVARCVAAAGLPVVAAAGLPAAAAAVYCTAVWAEAQDGCFPAD